MFLQMESQNIRREVAREFAVETVKQRGLLDKTNWSPEAIIEELDRLYKSFYDALGEKDITK